MPLVPVNAPLTTADPRQNPLRYMGSTIRILAALVDAMVSPWEWQEWRVLGSLETAILRERPLSQREGWNFSRAEEAMAEWGADNRHGIYRAAGLTPKQTSVAELFYERQFTPREIGHVLDISAVTVRVHLHDILHRLRALDPETIAA